MTDELDGRSQLCRIGNVSFTDRTNTLCVNIVTFEGLTVRESGKNTDLSACVDTVNVCGFEFDFIN